MSALALAGLLGLALVVGWGIRFGIRWERAGQHHNTILAAERRGWAISDAAAMAETADEKEVWL